MKLDFGCGKSVREGFEGVDIRDFGQKHVLDLTACTPQFTNSHDPAQPHGGRFVPWPWESDSVEEAHASHFLEHLEPEERIHFANELFRILKPGAKCTIITPHWASCRAYGDLTHKWPPVSEFWFFYLNKDWRAQNAPHNEGYTCDFEAPPVIAYNIRADLNVRNHEYQSFAVSNYKEAAQDCIATLTKRHSPTPEQA